MSSKPNKIRSEICKTLMYVYMEYKGDIAKIAEHYDVSRNMIGSILGSTPEMRAKRQIADKKLGIVRKPKRLTGVARKRARARKELAEKIFLAGVNDDVVSFPPVTEADHERIYLLFRDLYITCGGKVREVANLLQIDFNSLASFLARDEKLAKIRDAAAREMDDTVEASLYKAAVEGKHPTSKIFWLKNRRPEQWNDSRKIDITARGFDLPEEPQEEIKPKSVLKIVGADEQSEE